MFLGPLAFILLSSHSYANTEEKCSKAQAQHYILIHGIGGSQGSFGAMKEALASHIKCSKTYYYNYETGDSGLNTVDFAKGLNQFVSELPASGKKDINVVMHSQGGLVGLQWIINSYQENEGFAGNQVKRLNHYISLSTPFWGSDIASIGRGFFFGLGVDDNKISPFGKEQLMQMKYGSMQFLNMMDVLATASDSGLQKFLKEEVKILNIRGMMPHSRRVMKNMGGSQFWEGDMIVNTPSMQIDFNYANIVDTEYTAGYSDEVQMKSFDFGDDAHASGTHLDFFSLFGGVYGIVDVPDDCVELAECDHPGYKTLLDFVQTGAVNSNNEIKKVVQGFDLHLEIEYPEDLALAQDITVAVSHNEEIDLSNYRLDGDLQKPLRVYDEKVFVLIKGSILNSNSNNGFVDIEIDHPEIETRTLRIPVEKGKVNYLKLSVDEI